MTDDPMNIAVMGINYYPELTGIAVYTSGMCDYLAKKGHAVDVYTAFPYYPFGSDYSSWYRERGVNKYAFFYSERAHGIGIFRANLFKPKRPGTLMRIIHILTFALLSVIRFCVRGKRYDIIICVLPPFFLGFVFCIFARAIGIKIIFHIQDLEPDMAIDLGMIRNKIFIKIIRFMETFIYSNAGMVFTISEAMRSRIIAKGIRHDKVRLFYNWSETWERDDAGKGDLLRKYNLSGKFVVLHAGNMGEKQDIETILRAALDARSDESIVFLLVGGGSKLDYVKDYISRHGLKNIIILGIMPRGVINNIYSLCDVSLIMQDNRAGDSAMPSKLFGPAAAAKPFIIAADGNCEVSRIALGHRFGVVIAPEDARSLLDAICKLKNNRKTAEQMGNNARIFVEKERQKETILSNFEKDIAGIFNGKNYV